MRTIEIPYKSESFYHDYSKEMERNNIAQAVFHHTLEECAKRVAQHAPDISLLFPTIPLACIFIVLFVSVTIIIISVTYAVQLGMPFIFFTYMILIVVAFFVLVVIFCIALHFVSKMKQRAKEDALATLQQFVTEEDRQVYGPYGNKLDCGINMEGYIVIRLQMPKTMNDAAAVHIEMQPASKE